MRFTIETPNIEAESVALGMAKVIVTLAAGEAGELLRYQWYVDGRPIKLTETRESDA